MPPALPKFLVTEYASTSEGGFALSLNPWIVHTQHPPFVALIDDHNRLVPVDFLGASSVDRDALQAALNQGADFASHYNEHLDIDGHGDDANRVTPLDLSGKPANLADITDYEARFWKLLEEKASGSPPPPKPKKRF